MTHPYLPSGPHKALKVQAEQLSIKVLRALHLSWDLSSNLPQPREANTPQAGLLSVAKQEEPFLCSCAQGRPPLILLCPCLPTLLQGFTVTQT